MATRQASESLLHHRSDRTESHAAGSTFCPETSAATNLARLLVILFATHLFLDAATLDQLTETANGFLDRLTITNGQLNHPRLLGNYGSSRLVPPS